MKFSGNGTRNKRLEYGRDLDHYLDHLDPGFTDVFVIFIFWQKYEIEGKIAISVLMVGFESPGIELPWQRCALYWSSCLVYSFPRITGEIINCNYHEIVKTQ